MTEIENLLRSFNIDRPDIKELWSTGRFGTIAVPADRYKQYYDAIKGLQAQLKEVESELKWRKDKEYNETKPWEELF